MITWDPIIDIPVVSVEDRDDSGSFLGIIPGELYYYDPNHDFQYMEYLMGQRLGWHIGPPSIMCSGLEEEKIIEFSLRPG